MYIKYNHITIEFIYVIDLTATRRSEKPSAPLLHELLKM